MSCLYTFGSGEYSQLGLGNEDNQLEPVQVSTLDPNMHIVSISMGDGYGAVVTGKQPLPPLPSPSLHYHAGTHLL